MREHEEACFSISDLGSLLVSPGGTGMGRGCGAKLGTCTKRGLRQFYSPRHRPQLPEQLCLCSQRPSPSCSGLCSWEEAELRPATLQLRERAVGWPRQGRAAPSTSAWSPFPSALSLKPLLLSLSPSCRDLRLGLRGTFLAGGGRDPRSDLSPPVQLWGTVCGPQLLSCPPGPPRSDLLTPSLAHGRCSRNGPAGAPG